MRPPISAVGLIGVGAIAGWLIRAGTAEPDWRRRFVTHRFNPVVTRLGLAGGRISPWATLEHVGRVSGTVYRTPVLPKVSGDHAWIPLPYGTDVQWLRNVQAAGHCRLQVHETTYDLDEPAVVEPDERPDLPKMLRRRLAARGYRYLRLHVLPAMPATLDGARPGISAGGSMGAGSVSTG
jgi:deazaflavin-dependent oxidoreductase (nitroreductase family)